MKFVHSQPANTDRLWSVVRYLTFVLFNLAIVFTTFTNPHDFYAPFVRCDLDYSLHLRPLLPFSLALLSCFVRSCSLVSAVLCSRSVSYYSNDIWKYVHYEDRLIHHYGSRSAGRTHIHTLMPCAR